jgi:hypothetical protein
MHLGSGEPYVHIFVGNLAFTATEQDLWQRRDDPDHD